MKTAFLEINVFKATFILDFSNFTSVDPSCYKDLFFRDVSDRFTIQEHQISLRGPHLDHRPKVSHSALK